MSSFFDSSVGCPLCGHGHGPHCSRGASVGRRGLSGETRCDLHLQGSLLRGGKGAYLLDGGDLVLAIVERRQEGEVAAVAHGKTAASCLRTLEAAACCKRGGEEGGQTRTSLGDRRRRDEVGWRRRGESPSGDGRGVLEDASRRRLRRSRVEEGMVEEVFCKTLSPSLLEERLVSPIRVTPPAAVVTLALPWP